MDYKPGGGATICADYTAKQPADGYTLHITDSGPFTIVPSLRKLGYDSVKDFTPLAMIGGGGVVVVVHLPLLRCWADTCRFCFRRSVLQRPTSKPVN